MKDRMTWGEDPEVMMLGLRALSEKVSMPSSFVSPSAALPSHSTSKLISPLSPSLFSKAVCQVMVAFLLWTSTR